MRIADGTYICWRRDWLGFSINEGRFPNIHVSWWPSKKPRFYWYICLAPKLRWHNYGRKSK